MPRTKLKKIEKLVEQFVPKDSDSPDEQMFWKKFKMIEREG